VVEGLPQEPFPVKSFAPLSPQQAKRKTAEAVVRFGQDRSAVMSELERFLLAKAA
jgi:hypothetical protein